MNILNKIAKVNVFKKLFSSNYRNGENKNKIA